MRNFGVKKIEMIVVILPKFPKVLSEAWLQFFLAAASGLSVEKTGGKVMVVDMREQRRVQFPLKLQLLRCF